MRLPSPIYELAAKYFAHHGCWHELRNPKYSQAQRDECFKPGEMLPNPLRSTREKGCGEDFLRFHRLMIRQFKWIVETAPPPKYEYRSWIDFPSWLSQIFDAMDPFYRQKLSRRLYAMVQDSSLDDLGQFIEGEESDDLFPHIHYLAHDAISDYERRVFGPQPTCDMSDMSIALYNEHFWGLHGWIDDIYARWQEHHGEKVDQSALKPMMHEMCERCRAMSGPVSLRVRWSTYLKLRSQ